MAELERAPASVLKPLLKLIQEAVRLSTGDYRSAFVDVLCYVTRIASPMQVRNARPSRQLPSSVAMLDAFSAVRSRQACS
eukprot:2037659-Rhodomonas_salina.1